MQLFLRLNEIGQVIPASRSSEREQRNAIYDLIVEDDIPQLKELYVKIESSKDLVDKDAKQERKKQMRRELISSGIGAVGILVGVAGIVIAFVW